LTIDSTVNDGRSIGRGTRIYPRLDVEDATEDADNTEGTGTAAVTACTEREKELDIYVERRKIIPSIINEKQYTTINSDSSSIWNVGK
jgi:hypothetical protein